MKVQLLSFPDCPNAEAARAAVREAVARADVTAAGVTVTIEDIDISHPDAPAWTRTWGSPTILVDGVDVAGGACCRVDDLGGASCRLGVPDVDQIRAYLESPPAKRDRTGWPVVASVVAALAASACCWVPVVLALFGASGAGFASALAPWRPYLLVATGVALAVAFYLAYRPACCAPRRRMRIGLWLATVLVVAIAVYPYVGAGSGPRGPHTTMLRIAGMDCAGCSKGIARQIKQVAGVATVEVDFEGGTAEVTHDGARDTDLIGAVEDAGFEAEVVR